MPRTPQKVKDKAEAAIERLNLCWDLQLPHLYGDKARPRESSPAEAKRCSSIIRYLSFRLNNLDGLIKQFEIEARSKYSEWVYKPSQERGTLPTLPVTKSLLERDVRAKFKLRDVSDDERKMLLEVLRRILDEEYQLAEESKSYSRTEGPSSSEDVFEPVVPTSEEPQLKDHLTKSAKRSISSSSTVTNTIHFNRY